MAVITVATLFDYSLIVIFQSTLALQNECLQEAALSRISRRLCMLALEQHCGRFHMFIEDMSIVRCSKLSPAKLVENWAHSILQLLLQGRHPL